MENAEGDGRKANQRTESAERQRRSRRLRQCVEQFPLHKTERDNARGETSGAPTGPPEGRARNATRRLREIGSNPGGAIINLLLFFSIDLPSI